MTKDDFAKRDQSRNIGEEVLQAIRDIKAGKTGRIWRVELAGQSIGFFASQRDIRERALAIARGECVPESGDPKVWFLSPQTLADILIDDNALSRAVFGPKE